jgi:hypothetical protein
MEEWLLQLAPGAGVCVDYPSARQSGSMALAARNPKEDDGDKKKSKSEVEHKGEQRIEIRE